jgi:hypothetical protein
MEPYYAAIRSAAAQISTHHEKQTFLKVIYENFYKVYNPKAADRARNWDPEGLFMSIDLIALSIHNVVSWLRMLNGTAAQQLTYSWPENPDYFDIAMNKPPSLNNLTYDEVIDENEIKFLSREEILASYEQSNQNAQEG